ncbi:RT0821/Lpp0805 family surface protein [Devosia rhodophyticola]|uniref:RT0821/Lpp0805 family surface protein n=1 Tax=Devosia rhodophyticola TaxID=3026423 RepID=A0ABY7YYZ5_9HYPH|nr:RT0821/Lpp0805 family surface protein [Devosia rhodophyticola]WDR06387.1 RT0821/Lpp0805 family surface protein [Devosia rhodophyticola]
MNTITRFVLPLLALTLAGCTGMSRTSTVYQAPVASTAVAAPVYSGPTPAQTTQAALQTTSVSSGFVDSSALSQMSSNDSAQASSAQYYALQFGRPGAPRPWKGDKGVSGVVNVGPYVRVNNLDCRDFTHTVTIGGKDYVRKGTACREQTGNWGVVANVG